MCVLDGVNPRSFAGFGCESFVGVSSSYTGFTGGDCLWDLSLGRYTGDGKFDGETFLGRLWMFFLGGTRGGRETVRTRSAGSVFAGRHVLSNNHIFFVYYYMDQWGFRFFILQTISNPGSRYPGQTRTMLIFRQLMTSPSHTEDNVGTCCNLHITLL
jgi:hypothetical protein